MKKLMMLFVAAFMFFAINSGANAESFRVTVSPVGGGAQVEQEVFFDYEVGVWHGAPVSAISDLSAWADIDCNTHVLKLPDGNELVTLNNNPAIKGADGAIRPLN